MSAVIQAKELMRPMSEQDIDAILLIEQGIYDFPWSAETFQGCLYSAYCNWVLEWNGILVAYAIMSVDVGESHILNLCVSRDHQSRGLGKMLLTHLLEIAKERHATMTFLEVRISNFAAIKLYLEHGFDEIGIRHNYYPAKIGREDALILARTSV